MTQMTMNRHDYWNPAPVSIVPCWWIEAYIQYALGKGIDPDKLICSRDGRRFALAGDRSLADEEGLLPIVQK